MPRPKRTVLATIDSTLTPPDNLEPTHALAQITKAAGKNLYNASLADGRELLVELSAKFRSTIWIKRGSYVVVDTAGLAERENKLDGEIVNVVRDERAWRKMGYWYVMDFYFQGYLFCADVFAMSWYLITFAHRPKEFAKKSTYVVDSDEEESTMGKMPPADSDEE